MESTVHPSVGEKHQDALINELRNEVDELRGRQGNLDAIRDQINYLQAKYQNV